MENWRMLLENKNAVIYGGGGSIGSARGSLRLRPGGHEGLIAGRTLERLEAVVEEILSAGGRAEATVIDALDEGAVDEHADSVAASAGSIDISFNLISHGDVQGLPLAEMSLEDFERPIRTAVRTQFLTSRGGVPHDRAGDGGDPHVRRQWGS